MGKERERESNDRNRQFLSFFFDLQFAESSNFFVVFFQFMDGGTRDCCFQSEKSAATWHCLFPINLQCFHCTSSSRVRQQKNEKRINCLQLRKLLTMALKPLLFVLVVAATAAAAAPMAEAQLGLIGSLLGLIRIQGTLFCTANGNIGINGSATPVFPNAVVKMECGSGNVVSSAKTNDMGVFSIVLDPLQFLLSSVLSDCGLVVKTPLSNCGGGLPSAGSLLSPLKFVGNTLQGLLSIANLVPAGFQFQPSV